MSSYDDGRDGRGSYRAGDRGSGRDRDNKDDGRDRGGGRERRGGREHGDWDAWDTRRSEGDRRGYRDAARGDRDDFDNRDERRRSPRRDEQPLARSRRQAEAAESRSPRRDARRKVVLLAPAENRSPRQEEQAAPRSSRRQSEPVDDRRSRDEQPPLLREASRHKAAVEESRSGSEEKLEPAASLAPAKSERERPRREAAEDERVATEAKRTETKRHSAQTSGGQAERRETQKNESDRKANTQAKDAQEQYSVSACKDATISAIIKGTYTGYSSNHGKTVYRKDEKSKGIDVFIYYWDDRDGEDLCGWWFSPMVGGDEVWAYHPSRTDSKPPEKSWNVPHDGNVDHTFRVTRLGSERARDSAAASTKAVASSDKREREAKEDKAAASDPYGPPPAESSKDPDAKTRTAAQELPAGRQRPAKDGEAAPPAKALKAEEQPPRAENKEETSRREDAPRARRSRTPPRKEDSQTVDEPPSRTESYRKLEQSDRNERHAREEKKDEEPSKTDRDDNRRDQASRSRGEAKASVREPLARTESRGEEVHESSSEKAPEHSEEPPLARKAERKDDAQASEHPEEPPLPRKAERKDESPNRRAFDRDRGDRNVQDRLSSRTADEPGADGVKSDRKADRTSEREEPRQSRHAAYASAYQKRLEEARRRDESGRKRDDADSAGKKEDASKREASLKEDDRVKAEDEKLNIEPKDTKEATTRRLTREEDEKKKDDRNDEEGEKSKQKEEPKRKPVGRDEENSDVDEEEIKELKRRRTEERLAREGASRREEGSRPEGSSRREEGREGGRREEDSRRADDRKEGGARGDDRARRNDVGRRDRDDRGDARRDEIRRGEDRKLQDDGRRRETREDEDRRRRDDGRRDEGRREDVRREDGRREERARDDGRRDDKRPEDGRREDGRRDDRPREGRREDRREDDRRPLDDERRGQDDRRSRREDEDVRKRDEEEKKKDDVLDRPRRGDDSRREDTSRQDDRKRDDRDRRYEDEKVERREERPRRDDDRRKDDVQRQEDRRREDDRSRRLEEDKEDSMKREQERLAKEEAMKKKDEELQQKREQRRREEEEKKKKDDETRREELKKKREEEEAKKSEEQKKREAAEKEREEAEKKRKEQEALAAKEQQATLCVLQVLQKLSSATPENFNELKEELDKVMKTELPHTGSQQEVLQAEATRVLDYAQQAIGQEAKAAQEKADAESAARAVLEELNALVTKAEASAEIVYNEATPLFESVPFEDDEVMRIAAVVHKQGRLAMAACSSCADFIGIKKPIIDKAKSIEEEASAQIANLLPRIKVATRRTAEAFQKGKEYRIAICQKTAANRQQRKNEQMFVKYDSNADGILSIEDLTAFAKGEYDFDLPEENLRRIVRQTSPYDEAGWSIEAFDQLRIAVGIARTEVKGQIEKVAREQREAFIAERTEAITFALATSLEALDGVEPLVWAAEVASKRLAIEAAKLSSDDLQEKSSKAWASCCTTKQQLEGIRNTAQVSFDEVRDTSELEDLKGKVAVIEQRLVGFEERLRKALETAKSGRHLAANLSLSEYEGSWAEVVFALRSLAEADGKSIDDLFSIVSGSSDDNITSISTADIHAYLLKHERDIERQKVDKLFSKRIIVNEFANDEATVESGSPEVDGEQHEAKSESQPPSVEKKEQADDDKHLIVKTGDADPEEEAKEDKEETGGEKEESKEKETETKAQTVEGKASEAKEEEEEDEDDDIISLQDLNAMTVPVLKTLCRDRGLNVTGKKQELVDRLNAVYEPLAKEKAAKKESTKAAKAQAEAEAKTKAEAEAKAKAEAEAKAKVEAEAKAKAEAEAKAKAKAEAEAKNEEEAKAKLQSGVAAKAKAQAKSFAKAEEVTKDIKVSKDGFLRMLRMYYKVERQCVLSDNLLIEQTQIRRKLEAGEIIEILQGPTVDTSIGVYRVSGRCIKDGAVGWATIAGNNGITFLKLGGRVVKVEASVALTPEKSDNDDSAIRMLEVGEVLEVLEWARTSLSALGVTRIQARSLTDGAVGWATVVGNNGTTFLEVL